MTTPTANLSTELDDDHPLWYVNGVITDLFEGLGASEDHEALIKFLIETGLPEGTARMVHEAIARHHQLGDAEYLTDKLKNLPLQVDLRAAHEGTIQAARDNYAADSSNDIEIVDVPLLDDAGVGIWVSAWVWVPTPDEDG